MNETCEYQLLTGMVKQIASIFYVMAPYGYESTHEIPNFEVHVFPAISMLLSLEQLCRIVKGKRASRIDDTVINLGAGLIFIITRVILLSTVLRVFHFLHDGYRLVDLPATAMSTWLLSLFLLEFVYYWIHRSLHEVNLFWASHQFHHNAMELNVSTTLRDTIVDLLIYEFFPAPLALIIPPSVLLIHMQFSLIYQIWLHTECVTKLGPFEYIINTPSQHRVHHGKNKRYIDKNFGAFLMIFDRLFGTYESETERIVFGTTEKPLETFDSFTLHFRHYKTHIWNRFWETSGVRNKLRVLFYGPGYGHVPTKDDDPPEVFDRFESKVSFPVAYYCMFHGFLVTFGFYIVADHPLIRFSTRNAFVVFFYVLFALTSFGCIFDKRPFAPLLESLRCVLYFVFDAIVIRAWLESLPPSLVVFSTVALIFVRILHFLSVLFWLYQWLRVPRDVRKYVVSPRVTPLQKLVSAFTLIASFVFLWFVFSLRYDSCRDSIFRQNSS